MNHGVSRAKSTDSFNNNNTNNDKIDIVSMVKKQMITSHPDITPYNSNKTEDMISSTTPKDWYQFSNTNDNDATSPYAKTSPSDIAITTSIIANSMSNPNILQPPRGGRDRKRKYQSRRKKSPNGNNYHTNTNAKENIDTNTNKATTAFSFSNEINKNHHNNKPRSRRNSMDKAKKPRSRKNSIEKTNPFGHPNKGLGQSPASLVIVYLYTVDISL